MTGRDSRPLAGAGDHPPDEVNLVNLDDLVDLDDDVTVAADGDVVAEIRRQALAHQVETRTETSDAVDDDITAGAPSVRSTVARTPVRSMGDDEDPAPPVQPTPIPRSRPMGQRVAAPLVSPFADDDVSLIASAEAASLPAPETAWQPPVQFSAPPEEPPARTPIAFWQIVALLLAAVVITAIVTALIVTAVMG